MCHTCVKLVFPQHLAGQHNKKHCLIHIHTSNRPILLKEKLRHSVQTRWFARVHLEQSNLHLFCCEWQIDIIDHILRNSSLQGLNRLINWGKIRLRAKKWLKVINCNPINPIIIVLPILILIHQGHNSVFPLPNIHSLVKKKKWVFLSPTFIHITFDHCFQWLSSTRWKESSRCIRPKRSNIDEAEKG